MSRYVPLFAAALLCGGCVPVTEPVGDLTKAEPDKALVGTWAVKKSTGFVEGFLVESITVTAPEVKGNPKGLMRGTLNRGDEVIPMWFYLAPVGTHTYATVIVGPSTNGEMPAFGTDGAFAKWERGAKKQYFVFRVARDGDKLTLDTGNHEAFTKLMKAANVPSDGAKHVPYFAPPAGWITKTLGKDGPDAVFDKSSRLELERKK
jgi:hypothetical protein